MERASVTSWRELRPNVATVGEISLTERGMGLSAFVVAPWVAIGDGTAWSWTGSRSFKSFYLPRCRRYVPSMVVAKEGNVAENEGARVMESLDFYGIPNPPPDGKLRLDDLRERLIRQEETIIFSMVERSQFHVNEAIYIPGAIPIPGCDLSFSQYLLFEVEKVYARVRRYTSPDEHSFCPKEQLPDPILADLEYPPTLMTNEININERVEAIYRRSIVPLICKPGDDQNYGSSATCDVACLQALSKRIHYGKFIAEAKYQENPDLYKRLARDKDREGIWNALTNAKVEEILLQRVEKKAAAYGQEINFQGGTSEYKLDPKTVAHIYRDHIIPLTKEVEIDYLLLRPNGHA